MTKKNTIICNAFSLQMLNLNEINNVVITPISAPTKNELAQMQSAVGHPDTAAALGVACNRTNVKLDNDTTLIVAQLVGGRLPEGCTTLPDGFEFKYVKIELQ